MVTAPVPFALTLRHCKYSHIFRSILVIRVRFMNHELPCCLGTVWQSTDCAVHAVAADAELSSAAGRGVGQSGEAPVRRRCRTGARVGCGRNARHAWQAPLPRHCLGLWRALRRHAAQDAGCDGRCSCTNYYHHCTFSKSLWAGYV